MDSMLTEDYLIRRINQVIALLLHAVGLRKSGQIEAALTDIDIALELLLGMRALLLKQMSDSAILQLLTVRGQIDYERLVLVANLFGEEAMLYEAQGRSVESYQDYLRALNFSLEFALDNLAELPTERIAIIAALAAWFADRRLPVDTQAMLLEYDQALLQFDPQRLSAAGIDPAHLQTDITRLLDSLQNL
jgi:hypothetical protein